MPRPRKLDWSDPQAVRAYRTALQRRRRKQLRAGAVKRPYQRLGWFDVQPGTREYRARWMREFRAAQRGESSQASARRALHSAASLWWRPFGMACKEAS